MQIISIMGSAGAVPDRGIGNPTAEVRRPGDGAFESLLGKVSVGAEGCLALADTSEEAAEATTGMQETKADREDQGDPASGQPDDRFPANLLPELPLAADARAANSAVVPEVQPDEGRGPAQAAPTSESGRSNAVAQRFAFLADLQKQQARPQQAIPEPLDARSGGVGAAGVGQSSGTPLPGAPMTAQAGATLPGRPLPTAPRPETAEPAATGPAASAAPRTNHGTHRSAGIATVEPLAQGPASTGENAEADEAGRLASFPEDAGLRTQTLHENPRSPQATHTADERQARQVAHQMANAFDGMRDRPTEIVLDPEELGRVRMSLQAGDAAIAMFIQAERPETADLMRRHLDQLAQEFRALGYQDVTFHFADKGGQEPPSHHGAGSSEEEFQITSVPGVLPQASIQRAHSSALDLRL
jgi:flagellar hook-length control protein FliK